GENLLREFRIGDNRIDRDIREVTSLIGPSEGHAIREAGYLENMPRRRWRVGVKAAHRSIALRRCCRRRIEGNIEDRPVRQNDVATGDIFPDATCRARSHAKPDLHITVVGSDDSRWLIRRLKCESVNI